MTHQYEHAFLGCISGAAWADAAVRQSYLTVEGPALLMAGIEREGGVIRPGTVTHSVVNRLWMHQERGPDRQPVTMLRPWRTRDDPRDSEPDVLVIRFRALADHPEPLDGVDPVESHPEVEPTEVTLPDPSVDPAGFAAAVYDVPRDLIEPTPPASNPDLWK